MIKHKVMMLGMWGVGKTSLVQRFVSRIYDDSYHSTIGVKIDKKVVHFDNKDVTLLLWDIAGAEDQFSIPMRYLHGTSGYLIVIDGTRKASLDCASELMQSIKQNLGEIPYIPIINKSDLAWEITPEEVTQYLDHKGPIFKSSAKTGENVEAAFLALAKAL